MDKEVQRDTADGSNAYSCEQQNDASLSQLKKRVFQLLPLSAVTNVPRGTIYIPRPSAD